MSLQDIIRQTTKDPQDALAILRPKYDDVQQQILACEDLVKRAHAEVAQHRAVESQHRARMKECEARICEIERDLDEIDRRRQELIELLISQRDDKQKLELLCREAARRVESAQAAARNEQRSRDSCEHQLHDLEREIAREQQRLAEAHRQAVRLYVDRVGRNLEEAFAGREQAQRRAAAAQALKKARHEDPGVADLCEQRDQLLRLIELATVPGVNSMLKEALQRVEARLNEQFPGALAMESESTAVQKVEQLHYYVDSSNNVLFILPIRPSVWQAIANGEVSEGTTAGVHFIWSMAKGLRLKPSDGEFICKHGYCFFSATFGAEAVPAMDRFTVPTGGPCAFIFEMSQLDESVQEALRHEQADT